MIVFPSNKLSKTNPILSLCSVFFVSRGHILSLSLKFFIGDIFQPLVVLSIQLIFLCTSKPCGYQTETVLYTRWFIVFVLTFLLKLCGTGRVKNQFSIRGLSHERSISFDPWAVYSSLVFALRPVQSRWSFYQTDQ